MTNKTFPVRIAAMAAAVSLLMEAWAPVLAGPAQTATRPPAPASQAAKPPATQTAKPPTNQTTAKPVQTGAPRVAPTAAPAEPAVDGGWPRQYALASGGTIQVHQPQIASWDRQKDLVAFSAVSYLRKAGEKPLLGTIKIEATTSVALDDRLVNFAKMKIAETNFQNLPREEVREITAQIDKVMPADDQVIGLDRVLANLDKSKIVVRNVQGVKADPPQIFFSKTPAVIVNLDGEPIWSPIPENDLRYAVNTNWDLFQHEPTKVHYLRNDATWLKATDVKGPWSPAGTLPDSFKKLPADDNWKDVKANLPGKPVAAAAVPKVFVTLQPGELIALTGEPVYQQVTGTSLLWVSNTDSDIFRLGKAGLVYYLVTGRWFSAPDFAGPWTFASLSLPADFKRIPLEHERSRVLASVPGTDQAAEAVLLAQIPQTARVNRKQVKAPDLAYSGNPEFVAIDQTKVQRAVNTDKDVFLVGGQYYMCYQGVWFVGTSANGPWQVATSVPQEIYQIPASSPSHHVTYVTVEDSDDEWVTYAAAAGYTGMMVAWGCTVWGTGWYYPPYWGYGGYYPYYYGGFATYGYSAWYNPWTGAYGRSAGVYGPYGGAGVAARYNPRTGTYSRGAAAYGPYGARGVASAYNPRTGTYAQTRQGSNVYGNWGSTAVQRGDDWARTNRYTNRQGDTTRTIRTDDGAAVTRRGNQGFVGAGSGGDIYAGHDGNVYRRQDGTWQRYDNGGWNNTDRQPTGERPTPRQGTTGTQSGTQSRPTERSTVDQLNRDNAARREGSQRSGSYGTYRGSGGTRGAGSYRGGGGMRGGGRRR